jgi:hypothetical protein
LGGGRTAGREEDEDQEAFDLRVLLPPAEDCDEDFGALVVRSEGWNSWGAS